MLVGERAFKEVARLARGLSPGQSVNGHPCPRCGHRDSFSIFATDEGHGWKCHRVKCGEVVFRPTLRIPGVSDGWVRSQPGTGFKPREYPWSLVLPGDDCVPVVILRRAGAWPEEPAEARRVAARLGLRTRYGFSNEAVWELKDFSFRTRGHVSKDYDTRTSRTWRKVEGPVYGFFNLVPTRLLVIVEDCVSAARVALEGGSAVALCGTHMGQEVKEELRRHLAMMCLIGRPTKVVVALDPDAREKGLQLERDLTNRFGWTTMWFPTSRDPKDMDREEFSRLMGCA